MKYKILLFDLDDTLIDNKQSARVAFKRMLESAGQLYTTAGFERWYSIDKKFWLNWQDGLIEIPEYFKNETGKKSPEYLDWVRSRRVLIYFNNSISHERAVELNNIYISSLSEQVVEILGAKQTLKYLSDKHKIIIATNGPGIAAKQKLEKINCTQYITDVLTADMLGAMKPKIEFFEAIENIYKNYNRKDYLIIGDSLKSDIGIGMNAGIDSCWFNKNKEPLGSGYKPTFVIHSLTDLCL